MAELKIGDKVLVRKDLKTATYNGLIALGGMMDMRGKIGTITKFSESGNYFYLAEDRTCCWWSEGMLSMGAKSVVEVKF